MKRKNQMIEIEHSSLCNTKNNHFVPQFYLKSFQDSSGIIYCFDKETHRIHQTRSLKEIGCQKNLYTITTKITKEEIACFEYLFKLNLNLPLEKQFILYLTSFLNDEFKNLFDLKYKKNKQLEIKVNKMMAQILNSPDISRNQELLFSFYEGQFQPIYQQIIRTEQLSCVKPEQIRPVSYLAFQTMVFILHIMERKLKKFLDRYAPVTSTPIQKISNPFTKDPYLDCIHYLITQYFRTSKLLRSSLLEELGKTFQPKKRINTDNIMFLFIHFHGLNIINTCINEKYQLYLIKNLTDLAFITSDNPAVNPFSGICSPGISPANFEVFFPLSPKLGMLYSNCCLYSSTDSVITIEDKCKIDYWNKLLLKECERFVYGNSKCVLEYLGDR